MLKKILVVSFLFCKNVNILSSCNFLPNVKLFGRLSVHLPFDNRMTILLYVYYLMQKW